MHCVDTNVLVTRIEQTYPNTRAYRRLLERLANGDELLGLPISCSVASSDR